MKMMKKIPGLPADIGLKKILTGLAALIMLTCTSAQAFVLSGTRVILNEGKVSSINVISGASDGLLLIRSRASADVSGKIPAPELQVSPPLLRLESKARAQLRLNMITSGGLPRDRESIRYLHVDGIPSTNPLSPDRGQIQSGMVIGQGAIIKVFFRPTGIAPTTDKTWQMMTARRVPGGVELTNPTPYYMSFSFLRTDGQPMQPAPNQTAMLAPFSRQIFGASSVEKKEVQWAQVNDLGAIVTGKTVVQ